MGRNKSNGVERQALVESAETRVYFNNDGAGPDGSAVATAATRRIPPHHHLTCSLRAGVMLVAIALTLSLCSVWLCLDIRAMLIREAGQVKQIKNMVQDLYPYVASAVNDDLDTDLNDDIDFETHFMEQNVVFDYDRHLGRPAAEMRDPIDAKSDFRDSNLNSKSPNEITTEKRSVKDHFTGPTQCSLTPDSWKFDCHPEPGPNVDTCNQRGCCWQPSSVRSSTQNVPICFYPVGYETYSYVNVTRTETGFQLFLNRSTKSYYPEDVPLLRMDVLFETKQRLHIKITDALKERYEVPIPVLPNVSSRASETDYGINFLPNFGFQIIRRSTGEILFDTSVGVFMFCNQFLQLSAQLPSTYLYGLGEQRDSFVRSFDWKRITLFNGDEIPDENINLYGTHPFYLLMENNNQSHGVLLFNSNAMDIVLQPMPAITYRTIGGILDFYFFLGPTPSDVVSQYTELVGRPFMPPYWGLGFHLCRLGYSDMNDVRNVWQRTRDAGIPFDVQWTDIDTMHKNRDFTYDNDTFGYLPGLVNDIHSVGMHYVPIIDCAIGNVSSVEEYLPFDDGVKMDIFIKDDVGANFVGKVWPGPTVFPDFTNPNTTLYWTMQFEKYWMEVPFDGAWIDMNEPSNFVDGSLSPPKGCSESQWDNPPYTPAIVGGKLWYKTLCMSAQQKASIHYNVHNIYGLTEAIATNFALKSVRKKRPFIISRSTFPGSGHYGGVWTGDVWSRWHDMGRSVADILNFNLFGVPLVGADICGFNGNTTAKLCQRWMELGAFYPFARNHNEDGTIAQDPTALGSDVIVASVKAFYLRYQLLPYLYTLFSHAHKFGETVARPLFFEFPNDRRTYAIDTQFLWGSGLMILPVLEEDVVTINPYFPRGLWYLLPSNQTINSSGSTFSVDSPLDTIVVALRGGSILPVQGVNRTTTASRYEMFGLWVALCEKAEAKGEIYWDDGEALDVLESGIYNRIYFEAKDNTINSTVEHFAYRGENSMTLGKVTVYGVQSSPKVVSVNEAEHPFHYENSTKILNIEHLQVRLETPFTISWK